MTGCEQFNKWCVLNEAQPLPAAPADVARFVKDVAALGIEKVWQHVCEISRSHYLIGLADPTLGGPVSVAINAVSRIEPPASWNADHKHRFQQLPYDLQVYISARDRQRDGEVRRAQKEAAEYRKANEVAA